MITTFVCGRGLGNLLIFIIFTRRSNRLYTETQRLRSYVAGTLAAIVFNIVYGQSNSGTHITQKVV